jgi:hypothetical protein
MRFRPVILMCAALVVASAALADTKTPGEKSVTQPQQTPSQGQPNQAPTGPSPSAPKAIGQTGTPPAWTATTMEAATTEAQKQMLANAKPVTVTGEVVDVSCYMQMGKRGDAHVACGTKCIANGQPIGIVDAQDNLYIVMPEEHHPRRDGQADIRNLFASNLAKTVTVAGMMTEMKGYRALFVNAEALGAMVKPTGPGGK